jgi:hypothetical protein
VGLELTGDVLLTPAKGARDLAKQEGVAKILLEGDEIIFRGAVKAKIARAAIGAVRRDGDTVRITTDRCTVQLSLPGAAEKFAAKLAQAPKSRLEKMGIGAGSEVTLLHLDDAALRAELDAVGAIVRTRASKSALMILGVDQTSDLARIAAAATHLTAAGALWVVHPKGAAGVKDAEVFAAAKTAGLTYVKVARFSDTHTAEKLVIPAASRVK